MKKLVTMLFATLIGMTLSAATVDWNLYLSELADANGVVPETYTLYVFAGGDVASKLAAALNTNDKFDEVTYNNTLSAVTNKNTGSFSDFDPNGVNYGWAEGYLSGVDSAISFLVLTDGTKEDSTFYYSGAIDVSDYLYEVSGSSAPQSPGPAYVDMSYMTAGTVGVPEPTALALLALGIAGLALRRRA